MSVGGKYCYICGMIKNVVFDFGAVLVDWDRHYLYDEYFKLDEARDARLREKYEAAD